MSIFISIHHIHGSSVVLAGMATTNDELENMIESGNPKIFTQGVSKARYNGCASFHHC